MAKLPEGYLPQELPEVDAIYSRDELLTLINSERHEAYLLGVSDGLKTAIDGYSQTSCHLSGTFPEILKTATDSMHWKKETL